LISFYNLKDVAHVLPHSPILETSSKIAFNHLTSIDEIVFIDGRNSLNGLESFCDAVDQMVTENVKDLPFHSLTFFLSDRSINGIPMKDYIEFRSEKWPKTGIRLNVLIDQDYQTVLQYFSDLDVGRVAILPYVFGGSSIFNAELSGSGVRTLFPHLETLSRDLKLKDVIVNAIHGKGNFHTVFM
jgi:hypothetical protein